MGSINIDNTGSGADVTLSSDGTSLLLDGSAVGGGGGTPDLYAENPSSPTAPSATGTNAVAIGSGAEASATDGIAIGTNSDAIGTFRSIGIGHTAQSFGISSIALGFSTSANSTEGNAIGSRAQVWAGANATAIAKSYASGTDSFAAAIGSNSSSYGASGANSIAMGYQSKATGFANINIGHQGYATGASGSVAIGYRARATGTNAIALGQSGYTTASGTQSFALGYGATASNLESMAIGRQATTSADYEIALGGTSNFTRSNRTVETIGTDTSGTLQASVGNVFVSAPSANITYTFPTAPASGTAFGFTLNVTPSATVTVTWPASVTWAGGTAPDAPSSGETDVYTFFTTDGGTTWHGFQAGDAMA